MSHNVSPLPTTTISGEPAVGRLCGGFPATGRLGEDDSEGDEVDGCEVDGCEAEGDGGAEDDDGEDGDGETADGDAVGDGATGDEATGDEADADGLGFAEDVGQSSWGVGDAELVGQSRLTELDVAGSGPGDGVASAGAAATPVSSERPSAAPSARRAVAGTTTRVTSSAQNPIRPGTALRNVRTSASANHASAIHASAAASANTTTSTPSASTVDCGCLIADVRVPSAAGAGAMNRRRQPRATVSPVKAKNRQFRTMSSGPLRLRAFDFYSLPSSLSRSIHLRPVAFTCEGSMGNRIKTRAELRHAGVTRP